MNNMQLYLSIGIPTLTVILAWLSNRSDINRVNDKIDKLSDSLNGRIDKQDAKTDRIADSLRADMLMLRKDMVAEMVAFRREVHGDFIMLHERVVKVEAQQNS